MPPLIKHALFRRQYTHENDYKGNNLLIASTARVTIITLANSLLLAGPLLNKFISKGTTIVLILQNLERNFFMNTFSLHYF